MVFFTVSYAGAVSSFPAPAFQKDIIVAGSELNLKIFNVSEVVTHLVEVEINNENHKYWRSGDYYWVEVVDGKRIRAKYPHELENAFEEWVQKNEIYKGA